MFCHIFYSVLQDCTDVNWKLFDNADLGLAPYGPTQSNLVRRSHFDIADLGLAPYGPTQSNLVHRSHFDIGYVNLRQVTHLSARLMEKSCLAFK